MKSWFSILWGIAGSRWDGPYDSETIARKNASEALIESDEFEHAGVIGPLELDEIELLQIAK